MTENTLTLADSTASPIDSSAQARPGDTPSGPGCRTETPQRGHRLRVATCLAVAIVLASCGSDDTATETMTSGATGAVTAAEEVPCSDGLRTIADVMETKDLHCTALNDANLTDATPPFSPFSPHQLWLPLHPKGLLRPCDGHTLLNLESEQQRKAIQ